jgi:DNA polymerase-4
VLLRLRFGDYSRATRSHTLPAAAAAAEPILADVRMLLAEAMPTIGRRGLTLVGVTVANLVDVGELRQLELPVGGGETLVSACARTRAPRAS